MGRDTDKYLPGSPRPKLVREVRRHLRGYGVTPQPRLWLATWRWAETIAHSYAFIRWPIPSEIGSQYLVLLLAEMKSNHALRLPYRALRAIPNEVRALLPGAGAVPLIESNE